MDNNKKPLPGFIFSKHSYAKGYRRLLIYAGFNAENCLSKDYQVHHIDHNRLNNHFRNLMLINKDDHKRYHQVIKTDMKLDTYCKIIDLDNYYFEIIADEYHTKHDGFFQINFDEEYKRINSAIVNEIKNLRGNRDWQHSQIAKAILKLP